MPNNRVVIKGQLKKVDLDRKTAYGYAYVSTCDGEGVVDHSGQTWDIEEVRKTAHRFVLECRTGGEMHITKGGAVLVESMVFTKALQEALGIDLKKEGWFVGFRIDDDALLEKVEKGELTMFSIGGMGIEEAINADT